MNRMNVGVALLTVAMLSTTAIAGPQRKRPKKEIHTDSSLKKPALTKEFPLGACIYNFQYDADKYTEAQVLGFARFAPNSSEWTNIAYGQAETIRDLKEALPTVPDTLAPVLKCIITEHSFYLEFGERKQRFLQTNDVSLLKEPIQGVDPKKCCSGAADAAAKAKTPEERDAAVNLHWGNPMNREFRKTLCSSTVLWEKFLKSARIKAIESNCDGGPGD